MTQGAQTIYALASAQGVGGVAVIRISGCEAGNVLKGLTRGCALPKPREAVLREIIHPKTGQTLDNGLVLYFQGPKSFTGEDCVELHLHGGKAVVESVLGALSSCNETRLAEPGEFTRRAFENGKLDLTSAEAIADLVHAQTEAQAQQALKQMNGALFNLYDGWAQALSKCLAYAGAEIDFPDEDLPEGLLGQIRQSLEGLQADISEHLSDGRRGERLREGIKIALIGAPNAGKSSLMNALVEREVSIVTDLAGTTRDALDAHLNIGGFPVILTDTAGIRNVSRESKQSAALEQHDAIELLGIEKAKTIASEADIKLLMLDIENYETVLADLLVYADERAIIVFNKQDLSANKPKLEEGNDIPVIYLSCKTGDGIKDLVAAITEKLQSIYPENAAPSLTKARHREALENVNDVLNRVLQGGLPDDLIAEDLRYGLAQIGRITGRVDIEQLLDIVFRDFCIGK
jgi:tRNA modification GTPase